MRDASDALEPTTPALFHHCVSVYEAMLDRAEVQLLDGQTEAMVYEGFLTELITGALSLSVPYYTKITQALKKMGCIRQLRRGGSTSKSQWQLVTDPTLEAFELISLENKHLPYLTEDDIAPLLQQIKDLNRRIAVLEVMQTPKASSPYNPGGIVSSIKDTSIG
jgi:hypothetical protein